MEKQNISYICSDYLIKLISLKEKKNVIYKYILPLIEYYFSLYTYSNKEKIKL